MILNQQADRVCNTQDNKILNTVNQITVVILRITQEQNHLISLRVRKRSGDHFGDRLRNIRIYFISLLDQEQADDAAPHNEQMKT